VTTKSKIELPPLPATLPDGTVDCDPELPNPCVDTWESQQIARVLRWVNTPDPKPCWDGTATEFAERVQEEWKAGRIVANTLTAALEKVCSIYVQKNGEGFNVKSLHELLRKQKAKKTGNPL
jgi:hypothetical protein